MTAAAAAPSSGDVQIHSPEGAADMSVARQPAVSREEARVQEILADAELRDILLDPGIQQLIESLRTDPDKTQMYVSLLTTVHYYFLYTLSYN